jgi:hypothetical protein
MIEADNDIAMLGFCGVCQRPTLFRVRVGPPDKIRDALALLNGDRDPFAEHYAIARRQHGIQSLTITETLPPAPQFAVPEHVPESVATTYLEGLKALDAGLWEAGAFSVRKALERAVRHFVPDGNDGLKGRIKRLAGAQQVPPAIIELAHTVRAEGNVAVHEESWSPEEARQLAHFAALLFTYIFTLPEQVKRVAAERGAEAGDR